jgi:hypothetical protein
MLMAGLYDGSGGWAWHVGIPAKNGGGIVAVMPAKYGRPTQYEHLLTRIRGPEVILERFRN